MANSLDHATLAQFKHLIGRLGDNNTLEYQFKKDLGVIHTSEDCL